MHGSTALQVGGGAAGVIIVEDQDGTVPPFVCSVCTEFTLCAFGFTMRGRIFNRRNYVYCILPPAKETSFRVVLLYVLFWGGNTIEYGNANNKL